MSKQDLTPGPEEKEGAAQKRRTNWTNEEGFMERM